MEINPLETLMASLEGVRKSGAFPPVLRKRDIDLLQVAADGGNADAMFWLGYVLTGPDTEDPRGWRYIEQAALRGHAYAKTALGWGIKQKALGDGRLITDLPEECRRYWQEAAAAGDYEAKVGVALEIVGEGPEQVRLISEAAEAGYGPAFGDLARMYYAGRVVRRDFRVAADYFRRALAVEAYPSITTVCLAIMHLEGQGVVRSFARAMEYLESEAKRVAGMFAEDPRHRRYKLGELFGEIGKYYLYGDVADQLPEVAVDKARFWFLQAVQHGYGDAAAWYAALATRARGVCQSPRDQAECVALARAVVRSARLAAEDEPKDYRCSAFMDAEEHNIVSTARTIDEYLAELYANSSGSGESENASDASQ